jgi:hypothetical protein
VRCCVAALPGANDWASKERDAKRAQVESLLSGAKKGEIAARDRSTDGRRAPELTTSQPNFLRSEDVSFCVVESDDIRDPVLEFAHDHNVDTIVCGNVGGALVRTLSPHTHRHARSWCREESDTGQSEYILG